MGCPNPKAADSAALEPGLTPTVTVRYWAGARRAAGRASQQLSAATVGQVLLAIGQQPGMAEVISACSVLVDGRSGTSQTALTDGATVDVLPPFAGG